MNSRYDGLARASIARGSRETTKRARRVLGGRSIIDKLAAAAAAECDCVLSAD